MEALMILLAFVGYTLLQIGSSQPKNTSSIIINNVLSLVISGIMFWATGYAFAFGSSGDVFISYSRFFLIDATQQDFNDWIKHFAYLAIYIAIVNGGFAERLRFWIYPFLAIFLSGFVYPVSTHWAWHKEGWLKTSLNTSTHKFISYKDAGGAGVIHVSAGAVAVVAAALMGARPARKKNIEKRLGDIGGETNTNIFLGALLVLIGLGYRNMAQYPSTSQLLRSRSLVNSLLATATSAFVSFGFKRTGLFGENWNTKTLLNSAIMGMVAVSAAPGEYYPYGAFAIAFVSGCAYVVWTVSLKACRVDDISDTIAVNLGGGILGIIVGPLFQVTTGVFYSGKIETFNAFGMNMLGCVAIFAWHANFALVLLAVFACTGKLIYKPHNIAHETGFDIHEHDEPAYPAKETFPDGGSNEKDLAILTDVGEFNFYGKPVRAASNGAFAETKLVV